MTTGGTTFQVRATNLPSHGSTDKLWRDTFHGRWRIDRRRYESPWSTAATICFTRSMHLLFQVGSVWKPRTITHRAHLLISKPSPWEIGESETRIRLTLWLQKQNPLLWSVVVVAPSAAACSPVPQKFQLRECVHGAPRSGFCSVGAIAILRFEDAGCNFAIVSLRSYQPVKPPAKPYPRQGPTPRATRRHLMR